jgi:hypothetical protein
MEKSIKMNELKQIFKDLLKKSIFKFPDNIETPSTNKTIPFGLIYDSSQFPWYIRGLEDQIETDIYISTKKRKNSRITYNDMIGELINCLVTINPIIGTEHYLIYYPDYKCKKYTYRYVKNIKKAKEIAFNEKIKILNNCFKHAF